MVIITSTGKTRRFIIRHVRKTRTIQRKMERKVKRLNRELWGC